MNDEQLMVTTFSKVYSKYTKEELVVGKLANTEFKDHLRKGQEVDILMPPMVTLSDYDGKDLGDAEEAGTSTAKIRIDKAKSFHFYVDEVRKKEIADAPDIDQKVELAKAYCEDAVRQFAAAVDAAYADLYVNAGHYIDGNTGSAITLTENNALELFSLMQTKFQRGDDKGHTNWIDNQMIAVIPPEMQFYLKKMEMLGNVESGHRKLEKGFIGRLSGWDIHVSNNIKPNADGIMYPLFGIKGKTLAGGVQKKLEVVTYKPEKNFNTNYKGYAVYGVGAPRADLLGSAKIKVVPTLTQA